MSLLLLQKKFQPRNIPDLQLWLDANRIGVQGYSLDFDGTDDYVQANNVITAYPFTLECWVRLDVTNVSQRIMAIAETSTNNKRFGVAFSTSTGKFGILAQNTTEEFNLGTTTASANVWYHIAAVFTSATSRTLYVNASSEVTATASVTFNNSANNKLEMGRHFDNNAVLLNGKLSDVRIWNTARTAQEIADNYQKRLIGNESGLVGYWKLDKGSGTTVTDFTSNANTGTISGAIWDNSEPLVEAISDNTAVRVWADQSGKGYDATQSTTAARPTYIASGLNGLPVVRFDGTDDAMDLVSGALGMLRNVAGGTIFAVVKYPANNNRANAVHINNSGSGQRLTAGRSSTTTKFETRARRDDATATDTVTSNQNVTNVFVIQTSLANYQNTLLQQYINGALDGQKTDFQTSGSTSNTNSFNISLGYLKTTSTSIEYLNGDIAEIIVYNRALNTSELAQVHRYLSRKWGIQLA